MTTSGFVAKAFEKYFYDYSLYDQVRDCKSMRHAPRAKGDGMVGCRGAMSIPTLALACAGVPQVHLVAGAVCGAVSEGKAAWRCACPQGGRELML